jgi:hypothetical protein
MVTCHHGKRSGPKAGGRIESDPEWVTLEVDTFYQYLAKSRLAKSLIHMDLGFWMWGCGTDSDNRHHFFIPDGVFLAVLISHQAGVPANVIQAPAAVGVVLQPLCCLTTAGTTHRRQRVRPEPDRAGWLESAP